MNSKNYFSAATPVAVACALVAGCRTLPRPLEIGDPTATLKVTMTQFDGAGFDPGTLLYELSGCVPTVSGLRDGSSPVVSFSAPGIKSGLKGCSFRVKVGGQPPPQVTFVTSDAPGIIYRAVPLIISNDLDGGLIATAPLERLFVRSSSNLKGPAKGP